MCFEGFVGPFYSFLSKTNAICLLVTVTQVLGTETEEKEMKDFVTNLYVKKRIC